jgi:hypothetical protein
MLILFLLNAVGFYGIFLGLQFEYDREANKRLDDDQYLAEEAITLEIPLTVPYASDNMDFERVTGEFEYQGDVYRLVKQKLSRDTLQIVCVKDAHINNINRALTDYVKTFADHPFSSKQSNKLIQTLIKDYLVSGIKIESQSLGWHKPIGQSEFKEDNNTFLRNKIKYPPKSFSLA